MDWLRFKKIAWIQSQHLHIPWKFKLYRVSLREVKRQNIAGWCQQTFCSQKFVDNNQRWRWRWWDQIQGYLLNLFYFAGLYTSFNYNLTKLERATMYLKIMIGFSFCNILHLSQSWRKKGFSAIMLCCSFGEDSFFSVIAQGLLV